MQRWRKVSVLAGSAAAAALMALPRLEGAQKPPSVKTGDHVEVPVEARAQTADFDQTVVGRSPLQSEAAADACFTQAVSALATQRSALQRQCAEADGTFNTGTLTAGLHRDTCTVSQMVTCTGTSASRDAEARRRAAAGGDSLEPKARLNPPDGGGATKTAGAPPPAKADPSDAQ